MEQLNEKTIGFRDLWRVFKRSFILMVIAAIIVGGAFAVYKKVTYKPVYTSTSKMFILRTADTPEEAEQLDLMNVGSEMQYALLIIPTCLDLFDLDPVYAAVIDELDLNCSVNALRSMITVINNEDSNVITFRATTGDPEKSQQILTSYVKHARDTIVDAYKMQSLAQIKMDATLPDAPSNSVFSLSVLILPMLAALAVYLFFFFRDFYNDKIVSADDIAEVTGLTVLGVIPNAKTAGKGYGSHYGKGYRAYYRHTASKNEGESGDSEKGN